MNRRKFAKKDRLIYDAALWLAVVRYAGFSLFAGLVLVLVVLELKITAQQQVQQALNGALATYNTSAVRDFEQKSSNYQEQVNQFSAALNQHVAVSRVFTFLQSSTLPNVWFSAFNMTTSDRTLRLTGQAGSAQVLSNQVNAFQQDKQSVTGVNLTGFSAQSDGSVSFTMVVSLTPQLLQY